MANDPKNAMSSVEDVHSNDKKLKQDFPGFPNNPASEDNLVEEQRNGKTDFSNESDTTATGSESVRGDRPTEEDNSVYEDERSGNDRGMILHDEDPNDIEKQ